MHLQQTFNAAILTSLHPRSQIDIFVEVKLVKIKKEIILPVCIFFSCTHVRIRFFLVIVSFKFRYVNLKLTKSFFYW